MRVGDRFHLTYCSNIHPGETWSAVDGALRASLPRIRGLLGLDGPMGVGLRLSAAAAESLDHPEAIATFRAFLRDGDYYVFTINGFPYGAFHGERVKEQVYLPDWRTQARLGYTNRLASILATLLDGMNGIEGSVSTVPGGFRSALRGEADVRAIAANMLRHAAHLVTLRARTGSTLTLAIEPEPACFIENTDDALDFFNRFLFDSESIAQVARETGVRMGVEEVRRHIGICLDACHVAVEFEDPLVVLARFRAAGIRLCKIQVSSALRLEGLDASGLLSALERFAEDTYLHQVVERTDGQLVQYLDLPQALAAAAQAPSLRREWRVHFHVPVFLPALPLCDTTQRELSILLHALKDQPDCPYLEVETYTWDVLPAEHRTSDMCTAIARELSWTRSIIEQ